MRHANGRYSFYVLLRFTRVADDPGLALFYGGMVKSKNVLSTAMHSFSSIAIVSIVWVLFGYTLAFAPGNSIIGGLEWAGLKGVGFDPGDYSDTIPTRYL